MLGRVGGAIIRAGNPGEKTMTVHNASRECPQQETRRSDWKKESVKSTPLHSAMLEEEGSE